MRRNSYQGYLDEYCEDERYVIRQNNGKYAHTCGYDFYVGICEKRVYNFEHRLGLLKQVTALATL